MYFIILYYAQMILCTFHFSDFMSFCMKWVFRCIYIKKSNGTYWTYEQDVKTYKQNVGSHIPFNTQFLNKNIFTINILNPL